MPGPNVFRAISVFATVKFGPPFEKIPPPCAPPFPAESASLRAIVTLLRFVVLKKAAQIPPPLAAERFAAIVESRTVRVPPALTIPPPSPSVLLPLIVEREMRLLPML